MSKKGHHGGAWKVAYADFVTAMMALFLVLWLTAQDEKIKEAVQRAFTNPFSSVTKESVGILPNKAIHAIKNTAGSFDSASVIELTMLRRFNEELIKSIQSELADEQSNSIQTDLSSEGLRINIFDRAKKRVFEPDSTRFTPYGEWVFSTLAWQIARHKNFTIELEGHSDAMRPVIRENYDQWDLTSERANVARRKLIEHGVSPDQIRKVAGMGSTVPVPGARPHDEANNRVSALLRVRGKI